MSEKEKDILSYVADLGALNTFGYIGTWTQSIFCLPFSYRDLTALICNQEKYGQIVDHSSPQAFVLKNLMLDCVSTALVINRTSSTVAKLTYSPCILRVFQDSLLCWSHTAEGFHHGMGPDPR